MKSIHHSKIQRYFGLGDMLKSSRVGENSRDCILCADVLCSLCAGTILSLAADSDPIVCVQRPYS